MVTLVHFYREFERRHARLQQALAKVGLGAFLSGHDGWYFHGGWSGPRTSATEPRVGFQADSATSFFDCVTTCSVAFESSLESDSRASIR